MVVTLWFGLPHLYIIMYQVDLLNNPPTAWYVCYRLFSVYLSHLGTICTTTISICYCNIV